ncbi:hypothetical protein P1A145kb_p045 [Pectobacterium phage DU_PP_I]|nr:hypothetical protein P1A145kb_p045 [Pectobacterium phage DU_PP_I]ATS93761.1 hypothetical protein P12B145kb_p045 [Pectobacterium phage DU_PP_IV]
MFDIFCEWDVGQEGVLFTSEEAANNWMLNNDNLKDCFEDGLTGQEGIDDLISAGLLGTNYLTVLNEKGEKV